MMRKIIQIANSTQLVSLPKKWCEKYRLQKGNEIEIRENGNTLTIYAEKSAKIDAISIDISNFTPRLADRCVARAYQKGYDSITLHYRTHQQFESIQNKIKELLGFDIMDTTKNTILVQSISSKLEVDFEMVLKKAFATVLSMADTSLEAYQANDKEALTRVYQKDFDVNKFCYYCLRAINKEKSGGFGTYMLYYLIETLEDAGDSYKEIATLLATLPPRKELIKILSQINEVLKLGHTFFYKPDVKIMLDAMAIHDAAKEEIQNTFKKLKEPNELRTLSALEYLLRLVYHYPTMRLDSLQEVAEGG